MSEKPEPERIPKGKKPPPGGGGAAPFRRFVVREQRLRAAARGTASDAKPAARVAGVVAGIAGVAPDPKMTDARLWQALALTAFDRRTDPAELRAAANTRKLGDAIVAVTQFLIGRVKQRAAYAQQWRPFVPPTTSPRLTKQIKLVEKCFRTALIAAFPPVAGKVFPIRRFEQAFAAFVGGEIRTGYLAPVPGADPLAYDGVPDGANYFCFAEAVLLFLRLRLNPRFWTPLLRTFVAGAQVFASTYWSRGKRTWADYRCEHQRTLVPAAVVLATIDQHHSAMDPSRLAACFGDIVGVALRDDEMLPIPAPVAEELA
jgi:hypothetical protein